MARPAPRSPHACSTRCGAYRHHHGALRRCSLASVGVQVLRVLQAWCWACALGIDCAAVGLLRQHSGDPADHAAAGHDQRHRDEPGGVPLVLRRVGVGRAEAFALSVLFVALGIVGNLPGGLLYATGGEARQTA